MTEQFKVVAVSENTNSFGLHQFVLVAKSGQSYKAHASYFNVPKKDSIVNVPMIVKNDEFVRHNLTALGYEMPTQIDDCPREVLTEIFK